MNVSLPDISGRVARIVQNLSDPEGIHGPAADDSVLGSGGEFDSVWALQLVLELEREFGIDIDDGDVCAENFQDLSCLTEFVTRKLRRLDGDGA